MKKLLKSVTPGARGRGVKPGTRRGRYRVQAGPSRRLRDFGFVMTCLTPAQAFALESHARSRLSTRGAWLPWKELAEARRQATGEAVTAAALRQRFERAWRDPRLWPYRDYLRCYVPVLAVLSAYLDAYAEALADFAVRRARGRSLERFMTEEGMDKLTGLQPFIFPPGFRQRPKLWQRRARLLGRLLKGELVPVSALPHPGSEPREWPAFVSWQLRVARQIEYLRSAGAKPPKPTRAKDASSGTSAKAGRIARRPRTGLAAPSHPKPARRRKAAQPSPKRSHG